MPPKEATLDATCMECGSQFDRDPHYNNDAWQAKYCSPACAAAAGKDLS